MFFSDKVEAIYDVWFVGDHFFSKIFGHLQDKRRKAWAANLDPPYLYCYYNVFGYYTLRSSGNKHAIGHMLNSFIVGLNTRDRLPWLVVLVPDKDIIEDVGVYDDPHRAVNIIAENVGWLLRQMEILIKRKRMELSEKKPGAIYGNDPKVIVMEMIRRPLRFPSDSTMDGILSLRNKFNSLLNDAANYFGFNRMYVEACSSEFHFDRTGYLNDEGMSEFWKEVDELIECFDMKKIKMLPRVDKKEKKEYI